jgi:hypothetical protein
MAGQGSPEWERLLAAERHLQARVLADLLLDPKEGEP